MSIVAPSAPRGGLAALRESLSARSGRVAQLDPAGGALLAGPPVPLYRIEARDALRARPLRAARLISWEYPLTGGASPCIVSMQSRSEGPVFGGIIHGWLVSRMLRAGCLAENELGDRKQDYLAKLVDCPALRLLLLVAQARHGASAVIPLVEGGGGDDDQLALSWGLRRYLAAHAATSGAVLTGPAMEVAAWWSAG
jgi:hypothetical protein